MKVPRLPLILLGLFAYLFGNGPCGNLGIAQSTAPSVISESDQASQLTFDKLVEFATHGPGKAIDCGKSVTSPKSVEVAECGIHAFAQRQAFYLLYYYTFAGRLMSHGLAGDAEGNVVEIDYDSKGWLKMAFPKRSQFSNDDRVATTPCLKPISLIRTENAELACAIPLSGSASGAQILPKPINTTICEILKDPSSFNNKLVRVRGNVWVNFEYSTIDNDACSNSLGMWFALGGGSSPPGLVVTVGGGARPGAEDADGRIIPPFRVTLICDSNFKKFEKLMVAAGKADEQAAKVESDEFVFHQVSATFIGRIDGVSPEIHAFHLKRTPKDKLDFLGFGQAGQFDAQLVVKSVENDAILGSVRIPATPSKPK